MRSLSLDEKEYSLLKAVAFFDPSEYASRAELFPYYMNLVAKGVEEMSTKIGEARGDVLRAFEYHVTQVYIPFSSYQLLFLTVYSITGIATQRYTTSTGKSPSSSATSDGYCEGFGGGYPAGSAFRTRYSSAELLRVTLFVKSLSGLANIDALMAELLLPEDSNNSYRHLKTSVSNDTGISNSCSSSTVNSVANGRFLDGSDHNVANPHPIIEVLHGIIAPTPLYQLTKTTSTSNSTSSQCIPSLIGIRPQSLGDHEFHRDLKTDIRRG